MQGDSTAAKAAGRIFLGTARMELEHSGHRLPSVLGASAERKDMR